MKLLFTGAAGYAGQGICSVLSERHDVRGFDIKAATALTDHIVGDVADLDACRAAVDGVDAVVMCHMAPNPVGYQTPPPAIDINVKGTANLYHVMGEHGLTRAVLISSTGVMGLGPGRDAAIGDGPYQFDKMYSLTKVFQECLARHYHQSLGIVTTVLRPAWIVNDGKLLTKYGEKMEQYHASLIDPRDIGEAVDLALKLPDPTLEAFNLGQDDFEIDLTRTHDRLRWRANHRFESLSRQPPTTTR